MPRTAAVLVVSIGLVVAGVVAFDLAAGDVAKAHPAGDRPRPWPLAAPRPTTQQPSTEDVGFRCYGAAAVRCGKMIVDYTANRISGYAIVSLGAGMWVAVNNLRLQRAPSREGPWETVASEGDYDGWRWPDDVAVTSRVLCGAPLLYRAIYHWQWTDGSEYAEGTNSSHAVEVACVA